jgi:hypothetical protein
LRTETRVRRDEVFIGDDYQTYVFTVLSLICSIMRAPNTICRDKPQCE